jgi:regulatory protein
MNRDFGTKLLIFSYSKGRISRREYLQLKWASGLENGLKLCFKTGFRTRVVLYLEDMVFPGAAYKPGRISKEKAMQKLKHFCGYQERNHAEVRQKLYALGLFKKESEELISDLIEEGYLNEERFAIQFASGKFRIKSWGKQKILHALKQKGISQYGITKAMDSIDRGEYLQAFAKQADKKWLALKSEKNIFVKKTKWRNYLLQKGFEPSLMNSFSFPGKSEAGPGTD